MAFDAQLGRLFDFDEADLAANRTGVLSAQQQALRASWVGVTNRGMARGWRLLVVMVAVAAVLVVLVTRGTPGGGGVAPYALAGGMLAVMLIGVGVAQRRWRARFAGTEAASLRTDVGEFTWGGLMDGSWEGRVGEARFTVDRLMVNALEGGHTYRVHHLPFGSRAWVMSLERVDDPGA